MPINPVTFAHQVNEQFIKYQLTAFPITDPYLAGQARELLRGGAGGESPLIKGPYVSLSRSFKMGRALKELVAEGLVHPALAGIAEYPSLFAHQEETLRAALAGRHCLVATGTGSGKTESFLFPILDHCLRLRDAGAPDGVAAILVYPMNALAIDQLGRLRRLLAGTGITFGMYVGSTPTTDDKAANVKRMTEGEGREAFPAYERRFRGHRDVVVVPYEERISEAAMRDRPPRLLLTNSNQLELLLTRGRDLGMFEGAPLRFLVLDEAHTYVGAVGAEVALLLRRLRAFCGKSADDVICIGTSATITDPTADSAAGAQFAHRLFGVDPARVTLVQERYIAEEWPADRYTPPPIGAAALPILDRALRALEGEGDLAELATVLRQVTGRTLPVRGWEGHLYDLLRHNEVVYAIAQELNTPLPLVEAVRRVALRLGRPAESTQEAQAEVLTYLALGAAAARSDDPLLRPKVHYFMRGLEGAAVVFVDDSNREGPAPRLHFSAEAALAEHPDRQPHAVFPISVCISCGQHYLTTRLRDFTLEAGAGAGGTAAGVNVVWEAVPEAAGEHRVVFTDRFLPELTEGEERVAPGMADKVEERLSRKRVPLYLCRYCGAFHRHPAAACAADACHRDGPLVEVHVLVQGEQIQRCPACGQPGRKIGDRVIEPIRPLRATTVADVHILAQDMLNAVSREQQKLIVFSDNRQDAAFQAGWMQDHARRYRLRHLIYDFIHAADRPVALGDIQEHLLRLFAADRELARALAPEVYSGRFDEAFGTSLETELRYYLRIILVRELGAGFRQRDSLETWGLARVAYAGVKSDDADIRRWSDQYGIEPQLLAEGISGLLDAWRRSGFFHDPAAPVYTRQWREGDPEVLRGYLPWREFPPKGLKLTRETDDNSDLVVQVQSARGQTLPQNFVGKWGLTPPQYSEFIADLWRTMIQRWKVLEPVKLLGYGRRPLERCNGVYQVASQAVGLAPQWERHRCGVCQRVHTRPAPRGACTAMHCVGRLLPEDPSPDDYNIALLNQPFSMLQAQEHSAQVPTAERENIEREFKRVPGRTNCLVATPTLELGVDIGALDMVLMRNVPPRPANYWQRAGRAGRRHRMAVVYTYCRRSIHDSYFFADPERLLAGHIDTPHFNLKNDVMLRKHVHAAVLSELIRLSRRESGPGSLSALEREEIADVHHLAFPQYINSFLFNTEWEYLVSAPRVDALAALVTRHRNHLLRAVAAIFATYWPTEAASEVQPERLTTMLEGMALALQRVIDRLHQRMVWSVETRRTLLEKEHRGLLTEFEKRLRRRCEDELERMRQEKATTYALSVLAVEGFLPGYGVYDGGITAYAERSASSGWQRFPFDLTRPPLVAAREFVPGNLLYANGGRFRVAQFRFPVGERQLTPEVYHVDIDTGRVSERGGGGYTSGDHAMITGLPICDVTLEFISQISDEEENRFQLPVLVWGYRKNRHRGANAYSIGDRTIQHHLGQQLRLVNVGPADRVKGPRALGYPVCRVCGGARSPYASAKELEHFREHHQQRCGEEPKYLAFSADAQVDGLLIPDLKSQADASNLGEALRIGSEQVLEMDLEDLQLLVFPQSSGRFDLFLYDRMPGGSGLLSQILESWSEVINAARMALSSCPGACEKSCYDCMRTYRNLYYHQHLDRHVALRLLEEYSPLPKLEYAIPPALGEGMGDGKPTHRPEERLAVMLARAGFPPFDQQKTIPLGRPFSSTTPDFLRVDEANGVYVAIYLDGLSKGIHGDPRRAQQDRALREHLEGEGYTVIAVAASDLADPQTMLLHMKRIAFALRLRDRAPALAGDLSWYGGPESEAAAAVEPVEDGDDPGDTES